MPTRCEFCLQVRFLPAGAWFVSHGSPPIPHSSPPPPPLATYDNRNCPEASTYSGHGPGFVKRSGRMWGGSGRQKNRQGQNIPRGIAFKQDGEGAHVRVPRGWILRIRRMVCPSTTSSPLQQDVLLPVWRRGLNGLHLGRRSGCVFCGTFDTGRLAVASGHASQSRKMCPSGVAGTDSLACLTPARMHIFKFWHVFYGVPDVEDVPAGRLSSMARNPARNPARQARFQHLAGIVHTRPPQMPGSRTHMRRCDACVLRILSHMPAKSVRTVCGFGPAEEGAVLRQRVIVWICCQDQVALQAAPC